MFYKFFVVSFHLKKKPMGKLKYIVNIIMFVHNLLLKSIAYVIIKPIPIQKN